MYFKYGYLVSVIFAVTGIVRTDNGLQKTNVQIFYETLDPSSIKFFMDNFNDSSSVQMYDSFINLQFVPFGKAKLEIGKEEDSYTPYINMKCEHGEVECYGNKQHGCALKYTPNPVDAKNYIVCTMRNTDINAVKTYETYPVEKCFSLLKDLNPNFNTCISATNVTVMDEYKNMTDAIGVLDTLPVITIGNVYDANVSKDLVSNFHKALCTRLANTTGIEKICADVISGNNSKGDTKPSSATINSVTYLPTVLAIIVFIFFNVKLH